MAGRSKRPGMKLAPFDIATKSDAPEPPTPGNLDKRVKVTINDEIIELTPDNLETVCQLGRGAYGIVEKIKHIPTGYEMAVKRITMNAEQKKQLMDMDVLHKGAGCPSIVRFYGALFAEGDLWIFMEILDASLDRFYKLAFQPTEGSDEQKSIPEEVLGKIAASVIQALHYLHSIKIIHRDIKPSNILINRKGEIKLCDFGIAGYLVNSMAKTFEAGCKPYMAPERINPSNKKGYDIRSDVWSLGITMLELAIGKFPYPSSGNLFQQLKRVCDDEPPRLDADGGFSPEFQDFIVQCLQKDYQKRPYYSTLLEHPFIKQHEDKDIAEFVSKTLDLSS